MLAIGLMWLALIFIVLPLGGWLCDRLLGSAPAGLDAGESRHSLDELLAMDLASDGELDAGLSPD